MTDRSTIGDNASTAPNSSRTFGPPDSNELSQAFNAWKKEQLHNLQALKTEVQQVTHGQPLEAAVLGVAVAGVVVADIATHGALRGLAKEAMPSIEKTFGAGAAFLRKDAALADGALPQVMRADFDARLKAAKEIVEGNKPKSISMGDLDGWKQIELQTSIKNDKVVRGLTADLKESMATHTQIAQDLQIANRDLTQLSTELKGLKQLRSETVTAELTADSSPALKKIKVAQQNARDLATEGTPEERAAARRSIESAQESFEKAKAAAPARIDQIEGVAGKPGLLPRVQDHIAALQAKSAQQLDKIGTTAQVAKTRITSLKETGDFEKPTSEEDIALRKREQPNGTPRLSSSILTQEERTGIAAPAVKVTEVKSSEFIQAAPAKEAAADKPFQSQPFVPAPEVRTTRPFDALVAEKTPPFVAAEVPKDAAKAIVKDVAGATKETSGFADVDKTLLLAENQVKAFGYHTGSLRNGLAALKDYTDSVSQVMRTEDNADIRERVVADAVKNLDRLLQPLAQTGKTAVVDTVQALGDDTKFRSLRTVIERRLNGIERAFFAGNPLSGAEIIANRAVKAGAERPAIAQSNRIPEAVKVRRSEVANLTFQTRTSIEAFSKALPELPAESKVYAVRTDGSIVDLVLPSSREAGVTRVVPKRVSVAQISDLGAEGVLGRNFGKNNNDISGFVIVEEKRDESGAVIIVNANAVKDATQAGRTVEPIPDQVISRVIGNVPEELTKPGQSFLDFFKKFQKQTAVKAAEKQT
jgi:hypothetical protein